MKKPSDDHEVVIEDLKNQVNDLNNRYLRALADYQNLTKRTSEQVDQIRKYAAEIYIVRMLPILDTLENAFVQLNDPGLALAIKEFQLVLTELGVVRIKTVGEKFNPHEMECIEVTEGEDEVVVSEALSGYKLNGKIIRVARVKVGKKSIS
jgi:molecular chaperone GrpE